MLELMNISKYYGEEDNLVRALHNVSIRFRNNEFVSVLGPSGCGKTTLLNIIGGLDRYSSGDLLIDGKSTTMFKAYDWDAYRNRCIGFVFQSYNLIPHQTVLGNVELSLTLSGVPVSERKQRAAAALEKVGLKEHIHKKPNQLSGGQMQRVAIARALVNDPEIILADEPTGALDSTTSIQVLDLLKEIAKERLVVMVTHNTELAEQYSTRIIRLFDGEVEGDTDPVREHEVPAPLDGKETETEPDSKERRRRDKQRKAQLKKTAMSPFTAFNLSLKNLMTKKGRTFITSFAGSIGIIGIALVLAISNGFSIYVDKMQRDTLSSYPVAVSQVSVDLDEMQSANRPEPYPDDDEMIVYNSSQSSVETYFNAITEEYVAYVENMPGRDKLTIDIQKSYSVPMNVLAKDATGSYRAVNTTKTTTITGTESSVFQQALNNSSFLLEQYDVLYGAYPQEADEIAIIVDRYNRISMNTLKKLGIDYEGKTTIPFAELLSASRYKLIFNDAFYQFSEANSYFSEPKTTQYPDIFERDTGTKELTITGVLRIKESAPMTLYSSGLLYLPSLAEEYLDDCRQSTIGQFQSREAADRLYLNYTYQGIQLGGKTFQEIKAFMMLAGISIPDDILWIKEFCKQLVGASNIPTSIYIYPMGFDAKNQVTQYLRAWNDVPSHTNKILYMDASSVVTASLEQLIDLIKYVLIAFAAVSLVVSSIMIGIITYISVIERTKEIGVLRSLGARKRDISRVFNAETVLIGFTAGMMGIVVSYLLCIPINWIIHALVDMVVGVNLAVLNPLHALMLVAVSMALTLISGLIPSGIAANRDPVVALRSE